MNTKVLIGLGVGGYLLWDFMYSGPVSGMFNSGGNMAVPPGTDPRDPAKTGVPNAVPPSSASAGQKTQDTLMNKQTPDVNRFSSGQTPSNVAGGSGRNPGSGGMQTFSDPMTLAAINQANVDKARGITLNWDQWNWYRNQALGANDTWELNEAKFGARTVPMTAERYWELRNMGKAGSGLGQLISLSGGFVRNGFVDQLIPSITLPGNVRVAEF